MDSKTVSASIRKVVHPCLRDNGFQRFSDRHAWRLHDDRIDVVNFQSFNSYTAASIGCTTYSFSVNLGTYFRFVPDHIVIARNPWTNKRKLPKEYECLFRGSLLRSFPQKELDRRDVWYIDPRGRYLDGAMENARLLLNGEGMLWFERFDHESEILGLLLDGDQKMPYLWGFGNRPSPVRSLLTGYLALKLGQNQLAVTELENAAAHTGFDGIRAAIAEDIKKAKASFSSRGS